jgi:hypothetical protein
MNTKSLRSIYQLKVTLSGCRPVIWRRLRVASTDNLEDVHIAIQIAMGWTNSHLHEFVKDFNRYGMPDEDGMLDVQDETGFRLQQILKKEKDSLLYVYDYGDGWEHKVVLEKILPYKVGAVLPVCMKGNRACPPEDVGGMPGYGYFLQAIADPSHPEHDENMEWVGGDFDPERFDVAEVNYLLREYTE